MITKSAAGNVHLTFYDILMTVTMTVTTHSVSRFLNIYTEMYIHTCNEPAPSVKPRNEAAAAAAAAGGGEE